MKQEMIEMQMSYSGTEILGKKYDLIHIDFELGHPAPALIEMVQNRANELIFRTDPEAATFVARLVNTHIEQCEDVCAEYKPVGSFGY